MTSQASIPDQLESISTDAETYFAKVISEFPSDYGYKYNHDYWNDLPPTLKADGEEIISRLIAIAHQTAPVVRRSPLLTEADQRTVGRAFKGMRAAVGIREFEFEGGEIVHDEGTVLGLQPEREFEKHSDPHEAKLNFDLSLKDLKRVLDFADLTPRDAGDVPPATSRPIAAGFRPNTAFIMMMISKANPELVDVVNTMKECFAKFGISAVRADEIEHSDVITNRILDEIKTAEFLIADITGERPSVYYEVGYAHALGRRVNLYRKKGETIHFDLAAYNCPEYSNLTELRELLLKRLEALTGGPPREAS